MDFEDIFEKQKHRIDLTKMSRLLGVPVIAVNAAAERNNFYHFYYPCVFATDNNG